MDTHSNVNHPLLETPTPGSCPYNFLKSQFACPTGRLGWFVGQVMAVKNEGMNRFAVETLDAQSHDQVLEVGFGHGKAIQKIAARADRGFVAGIDISAVMVSQATRRNRDRIESGRVEISQASVSNIPYEFARFNKVMAVNNYQFWPNPEINLGEIQRVLREDGQLLLCLRLKDPGKAFQLAPGFTEEEVKEVAGLVRWVGFKDVRTVNQRNGNEAVCVTGKR